MKGRWKFVELSLPVKQTRTFNLVFFVIYDKGARVQSQTYKGNAYDVRFCVEYFHFSLVTITIGIGIGDTFEGDIGIKKSALLLESIVNKQLDIKCMKLNTRSLYIMNRPA